MATKVIFITGTDTGVGKTLLTALLLSHLRSSGACALALKPFCSGGRRDAELLYQIQAGELTLDEINPFYFPEPVAPLVSARKHRTRILLDQAVRSIREIAVRLDQNPSSTSRSASGRRAKSKNARYVLVEGSGGLLVPLGANYTVRDLIISLACDVIVVSRNRLGTLNHTLLTIQSLHSALRTPHSALKVVLMDTAPFPDVSCSSNAAILAEWIHPVPLVKLPYLAAHFRSVSNLLKAARRLRMNLERLV